MADTTFSFPNAPDNWSIESAQSIARESGLELGDDHYELIQCLQEYYSKAEFPRLRQATDALEEHFHTKGGMKYLYRLFPSGPIAQGCKLSGLAVPPGSVDPSFGSVA